MRLEGSKHVKTKSHLFHVHVGRRFFFMKTLLPLSSCTFALVLSAVLAQAQTAIYTFDSPKWVLNSTTPFLNMTPDGGSPPVGFAASFASSPTAAAFAIWTFAINPSFSGNNLGQPGNPPGDVLTITLNQPISGVHLDFEQFAPGYLALTSLVGGVNATTATQIGNLDFQPGASFTQFTLASYNTSGGPIPLAIDNLVLTIPEPSAMALAGLGAACLLLLRRKVSRLPAVSLQ
jgi:hypothetical protein